MSIFSVGGNSGFVVGPLLVAGATFVAGLHGTAVFLLLALCTASFLFFQMRGWQRQIPQSNAAAGQAEPRNDWHAFGVLTWSSPRAPSFSWASIPTSPCTGMTSSARARNSAP